MFFWIFRWHFFWSLTLECFYFSHSHFSTGTKWYEVFGSSLSVISAITSWAPGAVPVKVGQLYKQNNASGMRLACGPFSIWGHWSSSEWAIVLQNILACCLEPVDSNRENRNFVLFCFSPEGEVRKLGFQMVIAHLSEVWVPILDTFFGHWFTWKNVIKIVSWCMILLVWVYSCLVLLFTVWNGTTWVGTHLYPLKLHDL